MATKKNYLDEAGVKQLLDYLDLQHYEIYKKLDLLTPEYIQQVIKKAFDEFSLNDVIVYGGSAFDQIDEGLIVYGGSASTGGING